ncbi:hypothetical protein F5888DRAFT_1096157 [Russula emetica]|nr:hypothetical protein F5888DRAFT_1096157 [Russula emetica]
MRVMLSDLCTHSMFLIVPLPTSPPTNETSTETLSPQPEVASSEYFAQQPAASASPNIPPPAMPVPQVPRRAAPPRKKSSQKQTLPAEAEAIASSPEKETTIHNSSYTPSESQSAPVPPPGDVEPEVRATDQDADDVHLSDLADKNLELTEQASSVTVPPILSPEEESAPALLRPASPPLEPQPDSLDNADVDPSPTQAPDDIAEPNVTVPSMASQVTQEETEVEEVAIPHVSNDEALVAAEEEEVEDDPDRGQGIAEHVAEMGGEELPYISSAPIAVESHPTASAASSESVSYVVLQQGGGAAAVDEDDGNDGKY